MQAVRRVLQSGRFAAVSMRHCATSASSPGSFRLELSCILTFSFCVVTISRDNTGKGPTGVVVITLNRPDKLNALTEDMGEAFEQTVRRLSVDDSIR